MLVNDNMFFHELCHGNPYFINICQSINLAIEFIEPR
jgi:hypothetical protein